MATPRWLGHALDVADVWSFGVIDTWAEGDTATVTINSKDLTVTVGSTDTPAQVALLIEAMINGAAFVENETRNETGDNLGEFSRITASASSASVTLTGDDKGTPFTPTVSQSTVGDGTLDALTNGTAATGKNHFDNADNWSTGSVPVDSDDVVVDEGDVSIKYGLDQNAVTLDSITITQGFEGEIGLPETNEDDTALTYREYRDQYWKTGNVADANPTTISIGEGDGAGSGRLKIDSNTGQVTINVRNSGQRAEPDKNAIIWKGTHVDNELNVSKGDFAAAFVDGETAHFATVRVGFLDNQDGDSIVFLGSGVDIANAAVSQTGGTLSIDSATGTGTILVNGGELTVLSGAHASIIVDSGTCFYQSTATLASTKTGDGGTMDYRRDNRPRTVSAAEIYSRSTYLDPQRTITHTTGVDLVRCSIADVTLDLGTDLTLSTSSI